MDQPRHRYRGSLIGFAIAAILGVVSYGLNPGLAGAAGYPGPDAKPNGPVYPNVIPPIQDGGNSDPTYMCGFDVPNATNQSRSYATVYVNDVMVKQLPVDSNGCVAFNINVRSEETGGNVTCNSATPGSAWVSINGGRRIKVPRGTVRIRVEGVKSDRVGENKQTVKGTLTFKTSSCMTPTTTTTTTPVTTTTIPGTTTSTEPNTTTPTTEPPTTIPGQTTTSELAAPETLSLIHI